MRSLFLICSGGYKRSNQRFSIIENGFFDIGYRHVPMSKIDRYRFFNTKVPKNKREYFNLKFTTK